MASPTLQDDSGWGTDLTILPKITQSGVEKWANLEAKVPKKLLQRGYAFFSGSYVHDIEGM